MQNTLSKSLLLTLMLAVFLDIGNFFMPVPIYSPLFLHSAFLQGFSHEMRAIMLGVLVACYGLAQLLGAPIFGEISDQYGRKKAILLSMVVAAAGCVLSAISLNVHSILLIYIGRLLVGFGSGTIAVVFALAADKSSDDDRAKNLGLINTGLSIGAAVGPVIGGYLVMNHQGGGSGYSVPFYFMGLLYLLNIVLIAKLLPLDQATRKVRKSIHLFTAFQNLCLTVKRSQLLCALVFMALFFQIGIESFYLAAPVIAVKQFHMTPAVIANFFLSFGVVAAIVSWWVNAWVSRFASSSKIYLICVFICIFGFIPLVVARSYAMFLIPFISVGVFAVLAWIHTNNLFSEAASEEEQGLIFGVSQSLWSLGGCIGTLLVGFVTAVHYQLASYLPVLFEVLSFVAAIFMILALGLRSSKT